MSGSVLHMFPEVHALSTVGRTVRYGHLLYNNIWNKTQTVLLHISWHSSHDISSAVINFISMQKVNTSRVELLVSHRVPSRVADRGMLARYGGYRGNKISRADQNQCRYLAVERWIRKGQRKKTQKKKVTWPSRLGVVRGASYPSMENTCKLKSLNEGMEWDGKWKEVAEKAKTFNQEVQRLEEEEGKYLTLIQFRYFTCLERAKNNFK